ncbi:MAG: response regulator [Planctomycetota bacterium]
MIDEDVTFRRDVCEALEDAGYITMGAANGRDAIECLTFGSMRPDLIITDIVMPEVDGFEFRSWLESQPKLKKIPLIVMTGRADATALSRLRPASVLMKPFAFDTFMERVAAALRQAG